MLASAGLRRGIPRFEKFLTHLFVWGPFVAFIGCVFSYWGRAVDIVSLSLFVFFTIATGIGVTAGFHRLFTHGSYKTTLPIQYVLAVCGSMAAQNSFFRWVADHRTHHRHSDEEGDPHSPHHHGGGWRGMVKGFFHAHCGWFSQPRHSGEKNLIPDLRGVPGLVLINKLFPLWVALGLLLPAVIGGLISLSWWGVWLGFLWGGVIRLFFVYQVTWSINSICHIWGTRPFATNDQSRNNALLGLLGFGEGWHNNHHAGQHWARHGIYWYQVDLTWYFIWILKTLHLAWDIRAPSQEDIVRVKKRLVEKKQK